MPIPSAVPIDMSIMRRLLPIASLLLIALMTPSAGELAENLVHLLTEGHTAHAVQDSAHEPDSPEHGCTGIFHVCPCHATTSFTPARTAGRLDPLAPLAADDGPWTDGLPSRGHRAGIFRPPIA